jgi:hypothetical protein
VAYNQTVGHGEQVSLENVGYGSLSCRKQRVTSVSDVAVYRVQNDRVQGDFTLSMAFDVDRTCNIVS